MADDYNLADELAYIASHPRLFTKIEMVAIMKNAEETIRKLRADYADLRAEIGTTLVAFEELQLELSRAIIIKKNRSTHERRNTSRRPIRTGSQPIIVNGGANPGHWGGVKAGQSAAEAAREARLSNAP
jgi:hypothetical protein